MRIRRSRQTKGFHHGGTIGRRGSGRHSGRASALPNFMRARFKGYHAGCLQNERNIRTALESYAADFNGRYPPDLLTRSSTVPAPLTPGLAACPSAPATGRITVPATYLTTAAPYPPTFVLNCQGIHDVQLGYVQSGFPPDL